MGEEKIVSAKSLATMLPQQAVSIAAVEKLVTQTSSSCNKCIKASDNDDQKL